MKIEKIKIQHCRGINELVIDNELVPNKPIIFVAPNGFGKTSLAHAFKSIINHTSERIEDDDRHNNDNNNKASIEIQIKEDNQIEILSVNESNYSNTITKKFDISVITNPSFIKTSSQNIGGRFHTKPKGKLLIDPISITEKINKAYIPVSKNNLQKAFGINGDKLFDFDLLFTNKLFVSYSSTCLSEIKKIGNENIFQQLEAIRQIINTINFSSAEISSIPELENLNNSNIQYKDLSILLSKFFNISEIKTFSLIWFLVYMYRENTEETIKYFDYERYNFYKKKLSSVIKSLNSSKYKQAYLQEHQGELQVVIPEPKYISNGQRDVLVLVSFLYQAQMQLKSKNSILIIDELFDYLDDANLTVAQYYISQLIEDFKASKRYLFPIILTHLNPAFFRNYVFQKQKVIYLNKEKYKVTPALQKLINVREDPRIKENVSKYLFHFDPNAFDFSSDLALFADVRSTWGKTGNFKNFLLEEYQKYIDKNGEEFDPLAICALTRVVIEEKVYNCLSDKKNEFLGEHKTGEKLKIALSTGIEIPEIYFLLRIIYDEGMHSTSEKNNTAAIEAKLLNPIIKEMIIEAIG